jgi:hypothetical protein
MNTWNSCDRRRWLKTAASGLALSAFPSARSMASASKRSTRSIAAVITAYEKGLHADVLIGKILEGWKQDGGPGPALTVASMYVEQFGAGDLARGMSAKYGVPIFDTIEKAITVGGDHIPVDGVISIGEHGDYPWNEKEQHLYPRRRFFREITDTFRKFNKVVPVFNDKHLGPQWDDAKWMYERAQQLNVPLMAGSSLAVTFREPKIELPAGTEIEAAVGLGYSGLDIYGAHTLDCFQSLVERRRGGETGVRWVQCLQGEAMWKAAEDGTVPKDVLEAALAVIPKQRDEPTRSDGDALFRFQYNDGLIGYVLMLPAWCHGTSAAVRIKGTTKVLATRFVENIEPRHPHFAYLLKGVERMMHTGKPSYPVERTFLTSGILDRALTSRIQKHQQLKTPELAISYQCADYPYAPFPPLESDPAAPLETVRG